MAEPLDEATTTAAAAQPLSYSSDEGLLEPKSGLQPSSTDAAMMKQTQMRLSGDIVVTTDDGGDDDDKSSDSDSSLDEEQQAEPDAVHPTTKTAAAAATAATTTPIRAKFLVQTAESFDSLGLQGSHSRDDNHIHHDLPSTLETTPQQQQQGTTTTQTKIDMSVTPRAALSEAVMGNLDFEILPDDDDENDSDAGSEDPVSYLLQCVEEISLEEDDEEGDEGSDHTDDDDAEERRSSVEQSKSLSFDSPSGNHLQSSMSAPNSPASIRRAVGDTTTMEPSSPDTSHHRRRISGFFAATSPRRISSMTKASRSGTGDHTLAASSSNDLVESTTSDEKASKRGQRFTTLIRTTMGAIKDGIKAEPASVSTTSMDPIGEAGMMAGPGEEQDSSSDESSYDENDQWLEDEAQIFDDDVDQIVDCGTFSTLPTSFLNMPPDLYDYLDSDLVANIGSQDISTFAWEHHLFVRGLLQLLFERDMIGVEDDVMDSSNVSKMGVLRKRHGMSSWRVKYVEVRKGNLTYFADKQNEKRKTVHLRKRSCICRGEELSFELIVDGGKRLLWMAKSEKECQGWIRAINQAMIGDMDNTGDVPLDLTIYQAAIDDFQVVQSSMKDATTRQGCLQSINSLLYRQTSSSALRVPMKWVRDHVLGSVDPMLSERHHVPDDDMRYTVRDFWNNLCNTSIVLNGFMVEGNSVYSGERVIGALSRCILEFDRVESTQGFDGAFTSLRRNKHEADSFISELEAVSYARRILSGAIQSTIRGDTQAAVDKLFLNADMTSVKLESTEPLHIDISFAGDDFSEDEPRTSDFVGWVETKSKKSKKWKLRYFVASEGVLSYFERANPRPYRLRGQIVLLDARMTQLEGNVLSMKVNSKERLLRFEDRTDLVKWKAIFDMDSGLGDMIGGDFNDAGEQYSSNIEDQHAQASHQHDSTPPLSSSRRRDRAASTDDTRLRGVRDASAKIFKTAADGVGRAKAQANRAAAEGMKRARNATDAGIKSIRSGAGMFIRGVKRSSSSELSRGFGRRRPTQDMVLTSTRNLTTKPDKKEPTVQAVVEINSVFKVVSRAHDTDQDREEDLLIVRVKVYQAFLLSGGQSGRIASGDELLLMEFSKAEGVEDVPIETLEPPASL